ncbi:GDSL-type esterase/lipase family protein [Cupriavidus sp. H18C1]|uniref:GDSL-type esterase/lipase family protein n=1 Tax=Cupriavidus sp. H18C1 TaxID=3241601 RepID=UPI003BB8E9FC
MPALAQRSPTILVLGDSLSAEYGIARGAGWVKLLEDRLRAERFDYSVVNASISGETTVGGKTRLPDLLTRHRPAVVVVELGANDALRGLAAAEHRGQSAPDRHQREGGQGQRAADRHADPAQLRARLHRALLRAVSEAGEGISAAAGALPARQGGDAARLVPGRSHPSDRAGPAGAARYRMAAAGAAAQAPAAQRGGRQGAAAPRVSRSTLPCGDEWMN